MRRAELVARAFAHTLFAPTTLAPAIVRLGFVQADPIRAPARAQDLILRQRVRGYRAGQLERAYDSLDIEEDYLYAYGFMPREASRLLHPRALPSRMTALERRVLDLVREKGDVHPRDLDEHLGKKRVVNAWGGYSQATKRALERLHHRGLLRIVRRERGVRIYRVADAAEEMTADERLASLCAVVANVLAPISEPLLRRITTRLRRWMPDASTATKQIESLISMGKLVADEVDGVRYVWPPSAREIEPPPRIVRLLAPFDPLVWDRARFEQLWGWQYRFEAYTPAKLRVRGYYALPMTWCDRVVGWANASVQDGALQVQVGYVDKQPKERDFKRELDAEVERLRVVLEQRD